MSNGFFSSSTLSQMKKPKSGLPLCGDCGFNQQCKNKLNTIGKGNKKILIVLSIPSEYEDKKGRLLAGNRGNFLNNIFNDLGIKLLDDCWITASLLCRPDEVSSVKDKNIINCSPNVLKEIETLKPNVIIPIGFEAVKSVIGNSWKESCGSIEKWKGFQIPDTKYNAWICPIAEVNTIMDGKNRAEISSLTNHIYNAVNLKSKPYDNIIDYRKQIERIINTDKAVKAIEYFKSSEYIAFDYETNSLKPETEGFKIKSCSISDGKRTIAFLWNRKTQEAVFNLLENPDVKKYGANIKYEDRVTNYLSGKIRGWDFDVCLCQHVLDNRQGITSLKFQSYLYFGIPIYNEHIEPYFSSDETGLNNVDKIDTIELLTYNGMDSLLTFKIAEIQKKLLCEN